MNTNISGLEDCECYIEDVIYIDIDSWKKHFKISKGFRKLN